MGRTNDSARADDASEKASIEIARLIAIFTLQRFREISDAMESVIDNLVTLERLVGSVTTTSTDAQEGSGSSSEASMGSAHGLSGLYRERPVD